VSPVPRPLSPDLEPLGGPPCNGTLAGGAPWDALHFTGEPIPIRIDDREGTFLADGSELLGHVVRILGSGRAPFGPVEHE
jgi:hypothetical protein